MKIDTHTHVLLTKDSSFDWNTVKLHFDVAREHGLDLVCLTEHMDARNFSKLYKGLFIENCLGAKKLSDGTIQLPNSLIVTSGTEVPLKRGGEVGLYTTMSVISSLNKENGHYSLEALIKELENTSEDYIIIANHLGNPLKWIQNIEQNAEYLDAIEILAKHIHLRDKYEEFSRNLNKPLIAGSDSHTWVQCGLAYTDVDINEFSLKKLKQAIRDNNFTIYLAENSLLMVNVSEIFRMYLKSYETV